MLYVVLLYLIHSILMHVFFKAFLINVFVCIPFERKMFCCLLSLQLTLNTYFPNKSFHKTVSNSAQTNSKNHSLKVFLAAVVHLPMENNIKWQLAWSNTAGTRVSQKGSTGWGHLGKMAKNSMKITKSFFGVKRVGETWGGASQYFGWWNSHRKLAMISPFDTDWCKNTWIRYQW